MGKNEFMRKDKIEKKQTKKNVFACADEKLHITYDCDAGAKYMILIFKKRKKNRRKNIKKTKKKNADRLQSLAGGTKLAQFQHSFFEFQFTFHSGPMDLFLKESRGNIPHWDDAITRPHDWKSYNKGSNETLILQFRFMPTS